MRKQQYHHLKSLFTFSNDSWNSFKICFSFPFATEQPSARFLKTLATLALSFCVCRMAWIIFSVWLSVIILRFSSETFRSRKQIIFFYVTRRFVLRQASDIQRSRPRKQIWHFSPLYFSFGTKNGRQGSCWWAFWNKNQLLHWKLPTVYQWSTKDKGLYTLQRVD